MKIFFISLISILSFLSEAQVVPYISKLPGDYSYQYALIEASRQKMIGNVNESIKLYQACIKTNPDCDVAYY